MTRPIGISPAKGQPKAVAMVICALRPAAWASSTISIAAASDSSELCPWLRMPKASLVTQTAPSSSIRPVASAR